MVLPASLIHPNNKENNNRWHGSTVNAATKGSLIQNEYLKASSDVHKRVKLWEQVRVS